MHRPAATIVLLRERVLKEASLGLQADLEAALRAALDLAKAAGVVGLSAERFRLRCVVGAFVEAAVLMSEQPERDLRVSVETLVDLTVRAFR